MAAAFSMTVLAGCGKSETKTAETTAAASADNSSAAETAAASDEKKDLREVNVVLDWYPNATTPLSTPPSSADIMRKRDLM